MEPADYLKPKYTFRQAAAAADFPVNTLRSNFQRGWFRSFGPGLHAGQGRAQRLCLGDLLVLAIAARLIDIGFRPLQAFNAAYPVGVTRNKPRQPRRRPFQPFDRDRFETFLIWRDRVPQVVPIARRDSITQFGLDDDYGQATVLLSLNRVEATLFNRLGLPIPDPVDG